MEPATPPPCLTCGQPVELVAHARGRMPKCGWRIIDGKRWRWFCSRKCSGVAAGKRNAETGLLARNLFPAAQARYRRMNELRMARFADDIEVLVRRGVPRDLAQAMLDRVFRLGRKSGADRQLYRMRQMAAMKRAG